MAHADTNSRALRRFAPSLALLAACILINYVDRGNLSIAAPLLKVELQISASQLGILLSAFFWTYTLLQFVTGWIVDRFNVYAVIALGYLVWSVATAATGLVHGFALFLVMRLLLGIGESVAFPSCSKILAWHLPEQSRGFANGAVMSGMRCGNAVGALGAGLAIARYGWRSTFIGMGLISLLWLPAWAKWKPSPTIIQPPPTEDARTTAILRQRSFWGVSAGHFASNYLMYFMVTWLPYYLVHERHLSIARMARVAGAYYLVDAAAAIGAGWIEDAWIASGGTVTAVRKFAMLAGSAAAATGMIGCVMTDSPHYLLWLFLGAMGSGILGAGLLAFAQTLAGPEAAGRWTGLQNGFANLAGVAAPALTGVLVDRTGSFLAPFAIIAIVLILGGIAWMFVVGPVEPIDWSAPTRLIRATGHVASPGSTRA